VRKALVITGWVMVFLLGWIGSWIFGGIFGLIFWPFNFAVIHWMWRNHLTAHQASDRFDAMLERRFGPRRVR